MTTCPLLARLRAQDAAADRILAGGAYHAPPYALGWHEDPPAGAGTYRWRLSDQWEEVERELDASGMVYSHRFRQPVKAVRVGGWWWY